MEKLLLLNFLDLTAEMPFVWFFPVKYADLKKNQKKKKLPFDIVIWNILIKMRMEFITLLYWNCSVLLICFSSSLKSLGYSKWGYMARGDFFAWF